MPKPCISCGKRKPLSSFYSHPAMRDGHLNKCKPCCREAMREHRLTTPAVQERDRKRSRPPEHKVAVARAVVKWRTVEPARYAARTALNNAVRDGRIAKGKCVVCGSADRINGFQRDVRRPLDVVWLCTRCRVRVTNAFPELKMPPRTRS